MAVILLYQEAPMRAAYMGHEALTFTDYIDLETSRTLHAEPGGVYDIVPASGRLVDETPSPWFVPLGEEGEPALPEPEPEPEPQSEAEAASDPEQGTGEGQSF